MPTILTRNQQKMLEEPLSSLGLSVRTANTLDSHGVYTLEELLHCCGLAIMCNDCVHWTGTRTEIEDEVMDDGECDRGCTLRLLGIPNFGVKTLQEVYDLLERHGFKRSTLPTSKKPKKRKRAKRDQYPDW